MLTLGNDIDTIEQKTEYRRLKSEVFQVATDSKNYN